MIRKTMTKKELENKKTQLRAALLNMDQKGELGRVANATGISGGIETLREMINNPDSIAFMDIAILGMYFNINA